MYNNALKIGSTSMGGYTTLLRELKWKLVHMDKLFIIRS